MTETNIQIKNPGEALCIQYKHDFERALGYELITGQLGFDSFLMAVKEDVLNSPKLSDAFRKSPATAISALLLAAQCKLLPGSKYGLLYLIPRNRKGFPEVQPLIGYKGLATMAQRHPRVHSVEAFLVYEGEEFDYNPGEGRVHHKWNPSIERPDEAIIAAYAKVIITEPTTSHVVESPIVHAMTIKEIHKRRAVSEAYKYAEHNGKKDSPWHLWYPEMCRKTAMRAIISGGAIPKDMGLGGALSQEEKADIRQEASPLPPAITQGSRVRQSLGLDQPTTAQFDLAEQAVAAIQQAKTIAELEGLAAGWQHFTDLDAETIAIAYENRCQELSS